MVTARLAGRDGAAGARRSRTRPALAGSRCRSWPPLLPRRVQRFEWSGQWPPTRAAHADPCQDDQAAPVDPAATALMTASQKAFRAVKSVHMLGNLLTGGEQILLDMSVTDAAGGQGLIVTAGQPIQIVRQGNTVWVRGNQTFYARVCGSAAATQAERKVAEGRCRWLRQVAGRSHVRQRTVRPAHADGDGTQDGHHVDQGRQGHAADDPVHQQRGVVHRGHRPAVAGPAGPDGEHQGARDPDLHRLRQAGAALHPAREPDDHRLPVHGLGRADGLTGVVTPARHDAGAAVRGSAASVPADLRSP